MKLPSALAAQCVECVRALGLVFGAIDFRQGADGTLTCLEVNPSPQWIFYETRTQQPITAALARYLAAVPVSNTHKRPVFIGGNCDQPRYN